MFDRITPTNRAIILANVGVFLLQLLLQQSNALDLFPLYPLQTTLFRPWQLLTYGFMHGSWLHLFFNMFAVFMFGSQVEHLFGAKRYLIYYLTCMVGAALMHLIVIYFARDLPLAATVGASGAVFGLLLAFGMMLGGLLVAPIALLMTDYSHPINYSLDGVGLAAVIQALNAIGALTLVIALRRGKAIIVSPLVNAGAPLLTAVISLALTGVMPGPLKIAGIALALAAALLLALQSEEPVQA